MLVYDIEIAKCIPPRNGELDHEFEYCDGWQDHKGMGISSICSYRRVKDMYNVFMQDNFDTFDRMLGHYLKNGKQIIGFNSMQFDNQVLYANNLLTDLDLMNKLSYDLLQEIWRAVTGKQEYVKEFDWKVHAGYGLDQMCQANFGEGKSGLGALAPEDFQRGNYGSLIDYNLNDVRLTCNLFNLAASKSGRLLLPEGGSVRLRSPEEVLNGNV